MSAGKSASSLPYPSQRVQPRQPNSVFVTYQTLYNPLPRRRAARLHLPYMVLCDLVELQPPAQFVGPHGAGDVLLVGEDEEQGVFHFAVLDDAGELGAGFVEAVAVAGVDYEDEALGAWGWGC